MKDVDTLLLILKMIINYRANCRTKFGARFVAMMLTWGLCCVAIANRSVAHAITFHDVPSLLKEQFRHSERVSYARIKLSQEEKSTLEQRMGRKFSKSEYVIFVASTQGRIDGYALIDEERGQHELITFAAFFDQQGRITRQEIIAYREPYGDGIRQERFRRQFYGRTAESGFALGKDIDSVSGATISAGAMCTGVRRATLVVDFFRQKNSKRSSVASL
jgi:Na+-translocating ferredoxin:NAD+ oxidoreductase RnfG subunit